MRFVVVTRHLDVYEGEDCPPNIDFSNMQDIDTPEVIESTNENAIVMRTLTKYVSREKANSLLKSLNEQVGNYILCKDEKRYTLVMILQLEIAGETRDFGLHLADIFCF